MTNELVFNPQIHRYTLNGLVIPSVTQILELAGIGPDLNSIPAVILENKRQIGEFVHEACEYVDMGSDEQLGWNLADGYVSAYRLFKAEIGFDVTEAELQVYSKRLRYAGTIDRIGTMKDKEILLDIKTTAILDMGYIGPQTAAYEEAYREMTGKKKSLPRYGLQLKPDGTYKLVQCKDKEDFQAFLAALNIYRWRERHGKHTG